MRVSIIIHYLHAVYYMYMYLFKFGQFIYKKIRSITDISGYFIPEFKEKN